MGRTKLALGMFLAVLVIGFNLPTIRAFAKHHMSMSDMITMAKTPADHEKLAAHYEQEAKAARAKSEEHKAMADAYRKGGRRSHRETPLRSALRWPGEILRVHGG